jgi:putative ABC transport system permease protein
MNVNLAVTSPGDASQQTALIGRLLDTVRTVNGVRSAAITSSLPPHVSQMHTTTTTPARQSAGQPEVAVEIVAGSADLFSTLGVPLLRGRPITASDTADSPRTLVLSATAATRLFPGQDAIGQRLAVGSRDPQRAEPEIVGVVGDVRYSGLDAAPDGAVYLPYTQRSFQVMYLVVATSGEPTAIATPIRRAIAVAEPLIAVSDMRTLAALSAEAAAQPRFRTLLLVALAGLALVMAAVGLYGVIAHAVANRTAEIGIRMALGAGRRDVLGMVMREGAVLTGAGLALGLVGAVALNRTLSTFLYGIGASDPVSLSAAVAFVAMVGFIASAIPAVKATQVDPLVACRAR